ncbi:MAG: hypothetical protein A2Y65_09105 [Deltaproteobacteria bacterium RBG_13_52_11]|nr:MAG: hypothetical protein A2Y65_09105 [Deltaproteobacteria bacterium RBG_13_52_11]
MEKPSLNVSLVSIIIILAIFVIGVVTYVSILGENHKIDRVIVAYFNNLKDGMYLEACEGFSSNFQEGQLSSDELRVNFNFLLELSLLKHYNLIDNYDYKVELKRSHFWIPFISGDSVRVSVVLRKKGDKGVPDTLSSGHDSDLTRNLIVVEREKRSWKIKQFTVADSSISDTYNDLRQNIDLNKYIKRTPKGFLLKNTEVNFTTLTPLDKRLLRFSLYNIQKSMGKDVIPIVKTKNKVM